jgi:hypothetical protein
MKHAQLLRIKKLLPKNIIHVAAKHNLREIASEYGVDGHIDASRIPDNRTIRGPGAAAGVATLAQSLMDNAGIKTLRKDAVRGLEIIFGLPAGSSIDEAAFFDASVCWAESYFAVPILSAVVHNDEAAPHCHVLLLPLLNGRMVGSDLMGNKVRLQAMQADFHKQVGAAYGLLRQMAPKRFGATARRKAAEQAYSAIAADPGMLASPDLRHCLQALIAADPEALMLLLGLPMQESKQRRQTFVGIMTKPMKPDAENPIGFTQGDREGKWQTKPSRKLQTLSCVGFASSALSGSPVPAVGMPWVDSRSAACAQ